MVKQMENCQKIDGTPVDGWASIIATAAFRNLPWHNITTELIDNALANHKPNRPCEISLAWNSKNKTFVSTDHGIGASSLEPFFKPGLSGGNATESGNSTFGTGLFACECHLGCSMAVYSQCVDGVVRQGSREIKTDPSGYCFPESYDEGLRAKLGIPDDGGTVVKFVGFAKRCPDTESLMSIAAKVGKCYSSAIKAGDLHVELSLNGRRLFVVAEERPDVVELFQSTVFVDGDSYQIEWGVTSAENPDGGCRIVYGAKLIEITDQPCGDYATGRFYGSIRVPVSAGKDLVDLLKRGVEKESMEEVYEQCSVLFADALQQSDELCTSDEERDLNRTLGAMLSKPKDVAEQRAGEGRGLDGTADRRDRNGRDPNGVGVEPQNSGRKRKGRKGTRCPDALKVEWLALGLDEPLARYDHKSHKITYNRDHAIMLRWKEERQEMHLAQVAAAQIAYVISEIDPQRRLFSQDDSFEVIYLEVLKRAAISLERLK